MGVLTVVRHAQASYLKSNYDKLSSAGESQARALGEYWGSRGVCFDAIYTGPRERQIRTAEIAAEAARKAGLTWPQPLVVNGFDEYHGEGVMRICLPTLRGRDDELGSLHRIFEQGEEQDRIGALERIFELLSRSWVRGELDEAMLASCGVESWALFKERVRGALRQVTENYIDAGQVAVFTSGGTTSAAVQTALETDDVRTLELSWMVRNASITEFAFSADRFALSSFNGCPHLQPEMLTYR